MNDLINRCRQSGAVSLMAQQVVHHAT